MKYSLLLVLLLSLSILAAPLKSETMLPRCLDDNQNTIVFRTLQSNTLQILSKKNLSATFFISVAWAKKRKANRALISAAVQQGHEIGLAIPSPQSLLLSVKCFPGYNCIRPVNYPKLMKYLNYVKKEWTKVLGKVIPKPYYIAFPNTNLIDLQGGRMYPNRYLSLETALMNLGYEPILVGFGSDTWNEIAVDLEYISLSNVFGNTRVKWTRGEIEGTEFMDGRKEQDLESVESVLGAVDFLRGRYNASVVSMVECLFQRDVKPR
ncbi:UNVERIFIED_CONTAM: hypothetical protein HDU68_004347 [Siphonaria sp. JEL0065]|nr:hypothetical protein HDU68_004347 [Siphonaria sp. JEL0065]